MMRTQPPCPRHVPSHETSSAANRGLVIGAPPRQQSTGMGFQAQQRSQADADRPGASNLLRYDGESHLITFGPTGSGKTTGPVILNAQEHPGPAVFIDPKGDVFEATAEYRRQVLGHEIVLLDLRRSNPQSGSFNPLDAFAMAGGDANRIARSFASSLAAVDDKEQAFWRNWALSMLTGGVAYLLDHVAPTDRNVGRLFDLFNCDDVIYSLAKLLDQNAGRLDRSTYAAFAGFLQLSDRDTRPSVLGSTQQHLMLWESDFVRSLTHRTSFDLQAFVDGAPMTIYVVPGALGVEAYAPLLRLWFAGLLQALMTRQSHTRLSPHRTLLMCDEAAALGRLDAFVTASTLLRSCGLQLWTFWQNPAQLEIYGSAARTIVDNAGVVQLLGARNQRMAQEFASLTGGITAEEIMGMKPDEQVVMIDGGIPQRVRRVRYFDIPEFARRMPGNRNM